jgi:hypothetical protein
MLSMATATATSAIAELDALRCRHDRLQPGAAQAIDRQRRRFDRNAGVHSRHAREIHVARFGLHDLTEHDMADVSRRHGGAAHRLRGHAACEFGGRYILQAAAESSYRGPDG